LGINDDLVRRLTGVPVGRIGFNLNNCRVGGILAYIDIGSRAEFCTLANRDRVERNAPQKVIVKTVDRK
jgi:hypothetical protein